MSASRVLVLGVVHGLGQAHGYQVRRELLTWRADAWAKVAPGSIYQALRTLSKHGMLEQTPDLRDGCADRPSAAVEQRRAGRAVRLLPKPGSPDPAAHP